MLRRAKLGVQLSIPHRQRSVLCSLHYLPFSRSLVVDAAKVQYAVNYHAIELFFVGFVKQLGIALHGVKAYHQVAVYLLALVVVECDDIRVVIML